VSWRGDGKRQKGEQGAITTSPTSSLSLARGRKSVPGRDSLRGYSVGKYSHSLRNRKVDASTERREMLWRKR
jgi:hypothetical protein